MPQSQTPKDSVSLKEYFDTRMCEQEKARISAYEALQVRLDSMNQFREQLTQQANTFISRVEHYAMKDAFDKELRMLQDFKANMEGKASQTSVMIAIVVAVLGTLVSVTTLILNLFGK